MYPIFNTRPTLLYYTYGHKYSFTSNHNSCWDCPWLLLVYHIDNVIYWPTVAHIVLILVQSVCDMEKITHSNGYVHHQQNGQMQFVSLAWRSSMSNWIIFRVSTRHGFLSTHNKDTGLRLYSPNQLIYVIWSSDHLAGINHCSLVWDSCWEAGHAVAGSLYWLWEAGGADGVYVWSIMADRCKSSSPVVHISPVSRQQRRQQHSPSRHRSTDIKTFLDSSTAKWATHLSQEPSAVKLLPSAGGRDVLISRHSSFRHFVAAWKCVQVRVSIRGTSCRM